MLARRILPLLLPLILAACVGISHAQITQGVSISGTPTANDCLKIVDKTHIAANGAPCSGTGAPTDAHYYTNQAEAGLSAEIVPAANVITLLGSADNAAMRTNLGLGALATTTPGTGIATALGVNVGSAGAPVLFNGAGGTPTSLTGTNITGVPPAGVTGTAAILGANSFTSTQTITPASGVSPLVLTGGTVTTDNPVINATQTWNGAGVTFNGIQFTATDTASTQGYLLRLKKGGTEIFNVDKSGNGVFTGLIQAAGNTLASNTAYIAQGVSADVIYRRLAAASHRFGSTDAAAPVGQTFSVQGVVAGTSNTAGTDWTIQGSQSTGTGAGGSVVFQTSPAGSTGTAQNAYVTALTIPSTGIANFPVAAPTVAGVSVLTQTGTQTGISNKTFVAPVLGAASATSLAFTSTTGIVGTATNDNAATGSVGEFLQGASTGTSLSTGTVADAASVALTAGDWNCWGTLAFQPTASTTFTQMTVGVNSTATTLPGNNYGKTVVSYPTGNTVGANPVYINTQMVRVLLAGSGTAFLPAKATFAASTMTVDGNVQCRRAR